MVELRWLEPGQTFKPEILDKHQLLYFMEGTGKIKINLEGKDYEVGRGAGIYLGPKETASITAGAIESEAVSHHGSQQASEVASPANGPGRSRRPTRAACLHFQLAHG